MPSIGSALRHWTTLFTEQGLDSPRLSAEVLMARALGIRRLDLLLNQHQDLQGSDLQVAEQLLMRRGSGEPVAYILGEKEFYGRLFQVSPDVLIPRPETEAMLDIVKQLIPAPDLGLFADVCCGSGVIGITLACLFQQSRGILLDISNPALKIAQQNAALQAVEKRIQLLCSDLASALSSRSLDLLVANPPYIPAPDISRLERGISQYEPYIALDGGPSGLDVAAGIVAQAQRVLKNGAWLVLELGLTQPASLLERLSARACGWDTLHIFQDLSRRDRFLACQKSVVKTTHPVGQNKHFSRD